MKIKMSKDINKEIYKDINKDYGHIFSIRDFYEDSVEDNAITPDDGDGNFVVKVGGKWKPIDLYIFSVSTDAVTYNRDKEWDDEESYYKSVVRSMENIVSDYIRMKGIGDNLTEEDIRVVWYNK